MKDRELWKEIYEKYAKRMLTVCLRYSPGREEAEDFMHEGFMQVFRSLDKFTDRGEGSLRAWMERIMINTCLQGYRKKDVLRDSKPVETVPDTEDDSYLNEAAERVSVLSGICRRGTVLFSISMYSKACPTKRLPNSSAYGKEPHPHSFIGLNACLSGL